MSKYIASIFGVLSIPAGLLLIGESVTAKAPEHQDGIRMDHISPTIVCINNVQYYATHASISPVQVPKPTVMVEPNQTVIMYGKTC